MTGTTPTGKEAACREAARRIVRYFAEGVPVTEKMHRYMENTFADLSTLERILADSEHGERASLVSLLFSPDEAIRIELEPLLENTPLDEEEARRIQDFVMEMRPRALFVIPGGSPALEVTVDPDAAAAFIEKLHASRRLDPRVVNAIHAAFRHREGGSETESDHKRTVLRIKAMIRQSRAGTTRFEIDALSRFFTRFPMDAPEAFSSFSFFLDFLEAPGDEDDLYQSLRRRRDLYRKGLEKGAAANRQMHENNPETRMLSGLRLPYVDAFDLMQKIDILDRICFWLFETHGE
ncbi:MAG: hypothetical protein JRJ54_00770 [Deltaproteobacteria bacterium]|nr:hypothetical protein [Deltaproteobacteria bacterium]